MPDAVGKGLPRGHDRCWRGDAPRLNIRGSGDLMTTYEWREAPESAFHAWLQDTFRHARGAMWRLPAAWRALCLRAAARGVDVVDLDANTLRDFVRAVPGNGRPSTIEAQRRRLVEVLHRAFESIREHGLRDDNPLTPLLAEVPPVARPLPVVLGEDQRGALVRALHTEIDNWREQRDRAIALLVMVDGLRPAQVATAMGSDLLQIEGRLALRCDGARRPRVARLNRHTRRALTLWLQVRMRLDLPGDVLFPNDGGSRFLPADLYRLVRSFLRRAGIESDNLGHLDIRDCVSLRAARRAGLARGARPVAVDASAAACSSPRRQSCTRGAPLAMTRPGTPARHSENAPASQDRAVEDPALR
jgi:integrase